MNIMDITAAIMANPGTTPTGVAGGTEAISTAATAVTDDIGIIITTGRTATGTMGTITEAD